jgi:hypothetical protein
MHYYTLKVNTYTWADRAPAQAGCAVGVCAGDPLGKKFF